MKRIKKIILWLAVAVCLFAGIWITQDNSQPVTVTLFGFPLPAMPLGLWLLVMLAVGVALGMASSLPLLASKGMENRKLKKQTRE